MFNAACKLYVNRNDYELRQLISGFLNQKLSNRIIDDHNRLYLIGNTTSAFSKLINRVDNLIEAEMRKPALNKLSRSSSKAEPTSFTLSTGDGILKTIDENIIEIQTQQECLNNISEFLASNEFKIYKFAKFKQSLNQFLEHVNSRIYRDNLYGTDNQQPDQPFYTLPLLEIRDRVKAIEFNENEVLELFKEEKNNITEALKLRGHLKNPANFKKTTQKFQSLKMKLKRIYLK